MRMSCNGCRVLRKGCGDDCTIRPCLQWIKTPESQANATVFLAKFYGRAGLLNLLAAAPSDALRPAIFRSLLYESCGRIVNPIYGSVGLLWSGNWPKCQAAVEAVLKGKPIEQMPSQDADATPPLKAYDIRHVTRNSAAAPPDDLLALAKSGRPKFKRSAAQKSRPRRAPVAVHEESSGSHAQEGLLDDEHEMSVDAASHVSQREPSPDEEVGLDLTLGFGAAAPPQQQPSRPRDEARCGWAEDIRMGLALKLNSSSAFSSSA